MLSDIIETASSLHIRGFSGGQKEEQLVLDPQLNSNDAGNETLEAVKTLNKSRTQKSITRKSDGRKSSAPKKLSVLEDENVGEKTGENLEGSRYSILGSYLNSGKTQTLSTNMNPFDPAEITPGSSGMKL